MSSLGFVKVAVFMVAFSAGSGIRGDTILISGSGDLYMRIKISDHGNVYSFEAPQGREHISAPQPRTGILGESYVACSGGLNSWDAGALEQGWGPPTIIQPNGPNTVPQTMIRTTTNGQLRLRQTFTSFPLRQELKIEMTFIN